MAERAIVVHCLAHARAAVGAAAALGVPVTLASAPGAAGSLGALGFRELVAAAAAEHPHVQVHALLDCADKPGHVMAALRLGFRRVRFTGRRAVAQRLAGLAAAYGAELVSGRVRTLNLLDLPDPGAACAAWLGARPFASRRSSW